MCYYRYVYYSRCRHSQLILFEFCEKAHEDTGPGVPNLRNADADVQILLGRNMKAEHGSTLASRELGQDEKQGKDDAGTSVVDGQTKRLQQTVKTSQPVPQATCISGARIGADLGSGVARSQVTPPDSFPSPAKRLAALLCSDKPISEEDVTRKQRSDAEHGSADSPIRSRWIGRGMYRGGPRARRSLASSTTTMRGRSGPDQAVHPAKLEALQKAQVCLPKANGTSIDLRSPVEFPKLSPRSPLPHPPVINQVQASSWARVARLASADQPDSNSTSDPAVASDAGAVSTSQSSFGSSILDPVSLGVPDISGMAPFRPRGAGVSLRRPPSPAPPSSNIPITTRPGNPRRVLPVEWTAGLSPGLENTTNSISRPKSLGTLKRQCRAAHDESTVTPKSPTKVVPFELATARRAAEREKKDKDPGMGKVIPTVPKALPMSHSGAKSLSKAVSSASTPTSKDQIVAANLFPSSPSRRSGTAHDMRRSALAPPSSPSRIPRLVVPAGCDGHSRDSGSGPSPIRSEAQDCALVFGTAFEPAADREEIPSPAAPLGRDIAAPYTSSVSAELVSNKEKSDASENDCVEVSTNECGGQKMSKSGAFIEKARITVADVQHAEHPQVRFMGASELSKGKPISRIGPTSPSFSSGTSEYRNTQPQAELPSCGNVRPCNIASGPTGHLTMHTRKTPLTKEKADTAKQKLGDRSAGGEADARSSPTMYTWHESSERSISTVTGSESASSCSKVDSAYAKGSDAPLPKCFSATEVEDSDSSVTEEVSKSDGNLQWSLQLEKGDENCDGSTTKESAITSYGDTFRYTTSKRISDRPYKRATRRNAKASSSFEGTTATPKRLNAQAQEFVPRGSQIGSFRRGTAARMTAARPQVLPEWVITQPCFHPSGQSLMNQYIAANLASALTWKPSNMEEKPSKDIAEEHVHSLGTPLDRRASVYSKISPLSRSGGYGAVKGDYGAASGWVGAPVGYYGTSTVPSGGPKGIPNVAHAEPVSALRKIANASNGPTPHVESQPTRTLYLGRGGDGASCDAIPKGNDLIEKWWQAGWTSTNGGPLTHGAVYQYLRSTKTAHEKYPSIFRWQPEDGPTEYVGYGMLRPCGDMTVNGAYEALPHYPVLCPKCQPDFHETL